MKLIIQLFELLFILLENLIKALFELVEYIVSGIPKKNYGFKAEFGREGSLLSPGEKGFCLTGKKSLSIKNSYQNALVVGGTGTGKSSIVLLPSLYTMQGSFIIHDPSGELYAKSAGFLEQKGYEIKRLHFSAPDVSSGYNPLQRAHSSSDIQKVAALLVENALGKGSKDPFWNTQSVALLSMLISILKTQQEKYRTLYNVRLLLNHLGANPEKTDKLFADFAGETLYTEYKSFLAYDEKVINGVIATAKAALQIFSDEAVAKVTGFDSIDFADFRNRPTALFIQNSVADQKYYSALTSIFFEQFFAYVLSRFPEEGEQDIFFLIDECSSLRLPTLQLAVANVRKHRSGIMLIVQDFNQLIHHYGRYEAEAIRSNCFAKLFFTGQGLETAKDLEATLGRFEYKDKEGRKNIRSLMTSDEIRTMRADRALLICGHHAPVFAKLYPYYENRQLCSFSEIPAPSSSSEILFSELPELSINEYES
jgi:type IV secretion system protein VirD4